MGRSLVKGSRIGCPAGLVEFLENPPLVGDETIEDYAKFFRAIVADLNPVDAINWLYTRDVVDLAWQIRRERAVSVGIIKLKQKEVVRDHLKATFDASDPAKAAIRQRERKLMRDWRQEDILRRRCWPKPICAPPGILMRSKSALLCVRRARLQL
jgi:hypothetical protein